MSLRVLYFAVLRDRCGTDEESLPLPSPATVGGLKDALAHQHPFLEGRWGAIRVAVNQEFRPDDHPLRAGDEVALIPPVAGGAPSELEERVRLEQAPLSVDRVLAQVLGAEMGGVCLFVGAVRNHAHQHAVTSIDYSGYAAMALGKLRQIAARAEEQHGVKVACHHRLGHLEVGDLAVVIAAAAPHRAEAFAACRQVIEEIKQDVPIWKQETGPDGVVWVGMGP